MKRGSHSFLSLIVAMKTSMVPRVNRSRMSKGYEAVNSHSPVASARMVIICSFQLWLWVLSDVQKTRRQEEQLKLVIEVSPREKFNDSNSFQKKKSQKRDLTEHLNEGELF